MTPFVKIKDSDICPKRMDIAFVLLLSFFVEIAKKIKNIAGIMQHCYYIIRTNNLIFKGEQ
jgi:hypothetical protein